MAHYKLRVLRPGRPSKVEIMPDRAKIFFREEVDKGENYRNIVTGLREKYGVETSATAVCNYLRKEADQAEIAKLRVQKTREWSQALADANTRAGGAMDTNKILMELIQGDMLQFVALNELDVQDRVKNLPLDRLTDLAIKMAKVNIEGERLALQKKAAGVFAGLEKKINQREKSIGESQNETEVPPQLSDQLDQLVEQYGLGQLKAALTEAGLIPAPRNAQGLDPATLKTIREEVYGIFTPAQP